MISIVNKKNKYGIKLYIFSCLFLIIVSTHNPVKAQQYNSDSYIAKPVGITTIIFTLGQRYNLLYTAYSLIPRWEFTTAAWIYNNDNNPNTDDGYSTTFYIKYMYFQNKKKTGGAAAKLGTGAFPGILTEENRVKDAFRTYWMNFPVTIPFYKDKFSWDIMTGVTYKQHYGSDGNPAWSFTYSSRLAWYPFSPKWSMVGEVFGSEGQSVSIPQFKLGIRYEPNDNDVFSITYGQQFNGTQGALFEIGMMIYTPPFLSFGGRHKRVD